MVKKLAVIMVSLAALEGCHNTHPAVPTESPNPAPAVDTASNDASTDQSEASAEGDLGTPPPLWDMVTHVCPTFEEDTLYQDIYMQGNYPEDIDAVDTKTCLDGKTYCYAMDSKPIVQPKEQSGWECRYVQKLPSSHIIPNTYYIEEFTAGYWYADDVHRKFYKPVQGNIMKAWVCADDECTCGQKTCPQNTLCMDGECYCNDTLYKGGECELYWDILREPGWDPVMEMYVYPDESVALGMFCLDDHWFTSCKDAKGKAVDTPYDCYPEEGYKLYCDKMQITDTSIQNCIKLSDNTHAILYDDNFGNYEELYYKSPYTYDDIVAERKANSKNKAYRCGNETCVNGEICYKNHCAGLGTLAKLPASSYTWNAFMPECNSETGCTCGKSKCSKGQFCIDGVCQDTAYTLKQNGKWVRYGILKNRDYADAEDEEYEYDEEDDEEEENTDDNINHEQNKSVNASVFVPNSHIQPPNFATWFDILTHQTSQTCDGATPPLNVEDYICLFTAVEDDRLEAPQTTVTARGYYCIRPEGCACGNDTCPMHAQCRDNACVYDSVYLHEACHRNNIFQTAQEKRLRNRFVDERGWCRCGDSVVPPNLPGYTCLDAAGMLCQNPEGCPCGNVTCANDESCISPGNCKK